MTEQKMQEGLVDLVEQLGTWNEEGKDNLFMFGDEDIDITWAYWDDNDDTHYEDDAYYKHLEGIENVDGKIILHWSDKFNENFTSVDEDCQQYIYEELTDWWEWYQDEMEMENCGEGFQS